MGFHDFGHIPFKKFSSHFISMFLVQRQSDRYVIELFYFPPTLKWRKPGRLVGRFCSNGR